MSTIVAGRFDTFDNAQIASKKIIELGTTAENVSVFYVTPKGSTRVHRSAATLSVTREPDLRTKALGKASLPVQLSALRAGTLCSVL
jgi:hypothetical protein